MAGTVRSWRMDHEFPRSLGRIPPVTLLAAAFAVGLAVVTTCLLLALRPGGLGLRFAWNGTGAEVVRAVGPGSDIPLGTEFTSVEGGTDRVEFEALDFVTEPDGMMGDYRTYERFLERQDRMARIQSSEVIRLSDGAQVHELRPSAGGRKWTDLPPDFWVQVVVGLVAWMVSAAVFVFRPAETSARYLLLSGASTLLFAPAAAIYTTRELGMDGEVVRWASDLNFLGGSLFAASFVGLLLYYPRPLAPRWVGWAVVALFVVWFVLQEVGLFESMTFARRFLVMVALVVTFALAGVHWFRTRREPVERAALQWFLISWLLGTGLFALLILLPQMFGVDTSGVQGYAFLLFLLVYGGLAFGILRFRLFELGGWWRRILGWAGAMLVLVSLDGLFLGWLRLSAEASLALAVLVSGALWLPVRGWVWTRLTARRGERKEVRFNEVLEAALADPAAGVRKWRGILGKVFDPLRLEEAEEGPSTVALAENGLGLLIPGVSGFPALRLEYARGGRALFSPGDVAVADEMVAMMRHAHESISSYRMGVEEERGRIARDMHDNIGAQLLSALHSREAAGKDEQIRRTITGLREMIRNATPDRTDVSELLADLRFESGERLEAAGIELAWRDDGVLEGNLNPEAAHAFRSVVREAMSNVIRHAGARTVVVRVAEDTNTLRMEVSDDGCGFDPETCRAGDGLANMRSRVEQLGGTFGLDGGSGGTRLTVELPRHSL